MGRVAGLLVVALIALLSYSYFFKKAAPAGAGTPAATIDAIGARNDILAIAQAERAYQAEHGNYVSLDDLISSGELTIPKTGRRGFAYDVETTSDDFRVTARCSDADARCTSYVVTRTMEVEAMP